MDLSFYKSETSQRLRAEGFAEGLVEGRAQQRALILVFVLAAKDIELSDAERDRILGCLDRDQLDVWFERAIDATSSADVFEEHRPTPPA